MQQGFVVVKLALFSLLAMNLQAQESEDSQPAKGEDLQWVDGYELTVQGRGRAVPPDAYYRIDSSDFKSLPRAVMNLSSNSSGLSVSFQTNSKSISLKWTLFAYHTLANMTPIATNGLDLYGWNGKSWQYVASAKPSAVSNEVKVIDHLDGKLRNYRFYLPLYSGVKELEVGVDKGAVIKKVSPGELPRKKVVIYGSSITQGAAASRPGMAWPSLVGRHLNVQTFNMGFSGSGKMELPLADVLAKMDADVYILDCVPNPSPKEIKERAVPFIKRLRSLKPQVPIIMLESIYREKAYWNSEKAKYVTGQNKEFRNAYEQLVAEHYGGLYYIPTTGLTGDDHEATIDGTHLTDLGFTRLAKQVEAMLVKVFQKEHIM